MMTSLKRGSVTADNSTLRIAYRFVIFVAGRPKAALLFWFFGDFRCGVLLSMVIHFIYECKNSC